jgi:hypothetical protein
MLKKGMMQDSQQQMYWSVNCKKDPEPSEIRHAKLLKILKMKAVYQIVIDTAAITFSFLQQKGKPGNYCHM